MSHLLTGSTVLITGAAGFIGSHLARRLVDLEAKVFCLLRRSTDLSRLEPVLSSVERLDADLRDLPRVHDLVSELQPEHVFHLATNTNRDGRDWRAVLELNTSATLGLFRAAATKSLRRFVHAGSSFEYGDVDAPFKESCKVSPTTFFGATKAAGSILLQQHARASSSSLVILRIFHVYGPLEPSHRLVSRTIEALRSNRQLHLTAPGFTHDFIYVDDVVEACCRAAVADVPSGEIFNIATGKPSTNEHVAHELSRLMGKTLRIADTEFPARSWDRPDWFADISHARSYLGWSPSDDLSSGLQKTIDWSLSHAP